MKKKLILAALAACLVTVLTFGMMFTANADTDKNGTFNGSPAHVDGSGNLYVDEINFPDDNFRAYIKEEISGADDGILTEDEVSEVTYIGCSNNDIADLSGIEFFTSLEHLNCYNNKLTTLDVSANTELAYLYCYSNALTSLDVSANTALETLDCHSNALTSLDLSANAVLTLLDCRWNKLTSLDVSANTALKSIWCNYNELTSLDVSGCTALEYLDCYNNALTSLDVSANTALKTLWCENNALTSLDVSANAALKTLWCENNALTSLDVSGCTALERLTCYGNALTSLDVSGCTALTTLICSYQTYADEVTLTKTDDAYTLDLAALLGNDAAALITSVDDGEYDIATGVATFTKRPKTITFYVSVIGYDREMDVTIVNIYYDSILGDTDDDGEITNSDALAIFRHIFSESENPLDLAVADVDHDGKITNSDALLIFRCIFDPNEYPLV